MDEYLPYFSETRETIARQWGIRCEDAREEDSDWDVLRQALAERIEYLFKHDYNRLLSAVYILDISEARFKAALDQPAMNERALDLAQAILERETEKIISRKRYARKPPELEQ